MAVIRHRSLQRRVPRIRVAVNNPGSLRCYVGALFRPLSPFSMLNFRARSITSLEQSSCLVRYR